MSPLIELRDVTKRFGGLTAVDSLSFAVDQGEILGIIGPNGAGKTTVFNLITGVYVLDEGAIVFDGESLGGLKPNHIVRAGIARTFQAIRLFPNMSVLENVMVAQHCRTRAGLFGAVVRPPSTRREEVRIRERANEILAFFGRRFSGNRLEQLAFELSYADRRRLEIARAMATEPKLLLLDEPTAGMTAQERTEIIRLIERLRTEGGYSIILIEHDMRVVKGASDHVVALDYGKKLTEGTYEEVAHDPQVIEAYLGKAG